MADSKPEESFKVIDRRLFTPEGELREETVKDERPETEAPAVIGKTDSKAPERIAKSPPAPSGGAASAPSTESRQTPALSRGFQMLVDLLARNAAAYLGGMQDPRTGQAFLDLEGAREIIDMIDTLREKTRGNLAAEDEELLLEVIGSLKLSYMEVSKAAGQAMRERAGGKK